MAHYKIHDHIGDDLPGKCPIDGADLVTTEGPTYHKNALVGQIEYRSFKRTCPKCNFKSGQVLLRWDIAENLEATREKVSFKTKIMNILGF